MITAIDSSVLLAIFNEEPDGPGWIETLIHARREGRLIICQIVYAEIAPAFADRPSLDAALDRLGATVATVGNPAAWEAGRTFWRYRQQGGPREHLIPDFLIAAHARHQADRLAASDRGYLRHWFPDLPLLSPAGSSRCPGPPPSDS